MRILIVALLVLAGCSKKSEKRDAPSCADQVEQLAARLAKPRPLEEIRKTASPELAADLDAAMKELDGAARATAIAERLEQATAGCASAGAVFGGVAAVEGPEGKDDYLRTKVPPALLMCKCAASPEHVGGLVESILAVWERGTTAP
jgi:hypothetical protein